MVLEIEGNAFDQIESSRISAVVEASRYVDGIVVLKQVYVTKEPTRVIEYGRDVVRERKEASCYDKKYETGKMGDVATVASGHSCAVIYAFVKGPR
jgi:hypothetical protein